MRFGVSPVIPSAMIPFSQSWFQGLDLLAVGGDDLFIPVEAVLPVVAMYLALVVLVYIDEVVPLLHISPVGTDCNDGPPQGV